MPMFRDAEKGSYLPTPVTAYSPISERERRPFLTRYEIGRNAGNSICCS
jgi:hypothetical protein